MQNTWTLAGGLVLAAIILAVGITFSVERIAIPVAPTPTDPGPWAMEGFLLYNRDTGEVIDVRVQLAEERRMQASRNRPTEQPRTKTDEVLRVLNESIAGDEDGMD